MEKLWYKAVMIFAFSMTVVAAGYFLTGLNDQLAQQVQSGAVDNMSVVVLDAGHGGFDNGASYMGRAEKDDVLRLTLAVGAKLKEAGYHVYYTRTTDIYNSPTEKAALANLSGGKYFISFHRNSGMEDNLCRKSLRAQIR